MHITDLTHTITEETMVYPGTEPAVLAPGSTLARDGFRETYLKLYSHTGTHMDAPYHMLADGAALDTLDAARFLGRAYVWDCSALAPGSVIGPDALRALPGLETAEWLLLSTGFEHKWDTPEYFSAFPVLSPEAAEYLAACGLKGVGSDTMSVDPMDTAEYATHKVLMAHGMLIVENLCHLAPLRGTWVLFAALPLKYREADGAPVRAVAVTDCGR